MVSDEVTVTLITYELQVKYQRNYILSSLLSKGYGKENATNINKNLEDLILVQGKNIL